MLTQTLAGKKILQLTLALSPKILWWGLLGIATLFAVITIILFYHWIAYGYRPVKTGFMGTIYLAGSLVLLGIMFIAATAYTTSV